MKEQLVACGFRERGQGWNIGKGHKMCKPGTDLLSVGNAKGKNDKEKMGMPPPEVEEEEVKKPEELCSRRGPGTQRWPGYLPEKRPQSFGKWFLASDRNYKG